MNLEERIEAFTNLGKKLAAIDTLSWELLTSKVRNENSWFTQESVRLGFEGLQLYLNETNLRRWTSRYDLTSVHPKRVAVVMAGNIPLAGFHDFLSVLVSGHHVLIKQSSKDTVLLPYLIQNLVEAEPRFKERIEIAAQLKDFDAVIATGSDNSARYFNYYFSKYPHIIRKNRTSCAVLTGTETTEELNALGKDVFTYFGLGCRNVSKIYIPQGYDLATLFQQWEPYHGVLHHHKYHNNYDYQKSILLVNKVPFLDTGFVMLQESDKLVSPISVVYYGTYADEGALALKLTEAKDKIQCLVGKATPASIPFGQAQYPQLWDYADQIDTMQFLTQL